MDHRHLWIRIAAAARDPARPARGDRRGPRLLRQPRLHPASTRRSSRRRPARAPRRCSRSSTSTTDGLPDAERPALQRGRRHGARQDLLLRPDVPRREDQDAPAPDRVLDGRARDGVRRPRRRDGAGRGLVVSVVARVLDRRRPELDALERDTSQARDACTTPFPRITYDEAVDRLQARGLPVEWGGDFGGTDETVLSGQFDRPVLVHRYPAAIKAFYMKPDPERPELALCVDMLAPEGYGEIIGGGQRLDDLRPAAAAHQGARPAAGGVRVVPRPPPLRHRCPTPASAWASSASWPGSAASNTSARRFPTRACCTGCIRSRTTGGPRAWLAEALGRRRVPRGRCPTAARSETAP